MTDETPSIGLDEMVLRMIEQGVKRGWAEGYARAIEDAAQVADKEGHDWSGAPAAAIFGVADAIRALGVAS
jgi:hypothetical protein